MTGKPSLWHRILASRWAQGALAMLWTLALLEAALALSIYLPTVHGTLPLPVRNAMTQLYAERIAHHVLLLPDCARYDAETFYTLMPRATCRFVNIEYDTTVSANRLGLRDSDADLEAPQVIVLGDSFAMGVGVEAEETFAARLQAATGRRVLNAGINSFGTERELRMLRRLDRSGVETVIVQHSDNDRDENAAALAPGGFHIRSAQNYRRISAKHLRKTRYVPFKLTFYLVRDVLIKGAFRPDPDAAEQEKALAVEVDAFTTLLERMRVLAPGARFVITELNGRGRARPGFLAGVTQ